MAKAMYTGQKVSGKGRFHNLQYRPEKRGYNVLVDRLDDDFDSHNEYLIILNRFRSFYICQENIGMHTRTTLCSVLCSQTSSFLNKKIFFPWIRNLRDRPLLKGKGDNVRWVWQFLKVYYRAKIRALNCRHFVSVCFARVMGFTA